MKADQSENQIDINDESINKISQMIKSFKLLVNLELNMEE